jgi:hypothetical protein
MKKAIVDPVGSLMAESKAWNRIHALQTSRADEKRLG